MERGRKKRRKKDKEKNERQERTRTRTHALRVCMHGIGGTSLDDWNVERESVEWRGTPRVNNL